MTTLNVDVAVIGGGTAGMAAYREARKYVERLLLIENAEFGTTCARVGCMPSKLMIAAADAAHHARQAGVFGVEVPEVRIDGEAVMRRIRDERDRFVGFVRDAVDEFDDAQIVREHARFLDDHRLELSDGRIVEARAIVLATGSRPKIPASFEGLGSLMATNEGIFEWRDLPRSAAVFGTGVVALELGQALHRLGVRVSVYGRGGSVGPLTDPEVISAARQAFDRELDVHWEAKASVERDGDTVVVRRDGADEARFDIALVATGRSPNLDEIGLENTSVAFDDAGDPIIDPMSMRAGDTSIFIAGDCTGELPLLHEAADEGRIAGENAARLPAAYRRKRRTGLSIVFSDPQLAIAGESYAALCERGADFAIGAVYWDDQGRARVIGRDYGATRLYGEHGTGLLLGAELAGPAAEHLAHLLAWAIGSRLTVTDLLLQPFYHPVLEEGVRTALRGLNHELGFGPNPPLRCIDCGPGG